MNTSKFLDIKRLKTEESRIKKQMELANHIAKLSQAYKSGKKIVRITEVSKKRLEFLKLYGKVKTINEMANKLKLSRAQTYRIVQDLSEYETR